MPENFVTFYKNFLIEMRVVQPSGARTSNSKLDVVSLSDVTSWQQIFYTAIPHYLSSLIFQVSVREGEFMLKLESLSFSLRKWPLAF